MARKDIVGTPDPTVQLDISLRVWILRDTSRNKGPVVSRERVREVVEAANQIWAPARMRYRIESIRPFDSAEFYVTEPRGVGAGTFDALERVHWQPGISWINVYFIRRLKGATEGTCSFPGREAHAVVLEKNSRDGALAHELGHYFNLEHVWEDSLSDTNSEKWGDLDNIMTDFKDRVDRLHLTVQQIQRARRAAFASRSDLIAPLLWLGAG